MKCSELSELEVHRINDCLQKRFVLYKTNLTDKMESLRNLRLSKSDSFIFIKDELGHSRQYGKGYEITYSGNLIMIHSSDCTLIEIYHVLSDLGEFKDYYISNTLERSLKSIFNDSTNYEDLESYHLLEQFSIELVKHLSTDIKQVVDFRIKKVEFILELKITNANRYALGEDDNLEMDLILEVRKYSICLKAGSLRVIYKKLDSEIHDRGIDKW